MALSARDKAEMESFVSCLNNLLGKFRYRLEAGQAEAEGDMLLLPVEPGDLNQRFRLDDNGGESILVEQEQPERDHMGPGGYMIQVPKPVAPSAPSPYCHNASDMQPLSPAPSPFSPVKIILDVWASLTPALQKEAAEGTLRLLVRLEED